MRGLPVQSLNDPTMKGKLPKVVHKRLECFVTLFAKALVNDAPETVHDLRVASRRLQQALRLLSPTTKPPALANRYACSVESGVRSALVAIST